MDDERAPGSIKRRGVLIGGTAAAAAVAGLGVAGASAFAAGGSGTADASPAARRTRRPVVCSLTEEVTEGPYSLPGALIRQDVTEGKEGVPVQYTFTVVDESSDCAVLPDALVEIWHCDTLGEYSGFVGGNGHQEDDDGTFLRGAQITDANGQVQMTSIWPGHYTGRAVHVHLRVHTDVTLTDDSYTGGNLIHTGQLFFDPDINAEIQVLDPYSDNTTPETQLDQDGIYDGGGATSGLLTLTALGDSVSDGYAATITMGVSSS
jgi:protocatechuate 3,4-dioxygenase beta subunit